MLSPRAKVLRLLAGDELKQARPHLEEFEVSCKAVFLFSAAELGQQGFHGRGRSCRTLPRLLQGGNGGSSGGGVVGDVGAVVENVSVSVIIRVRCREKGGGVGDGVDGGVVKGSSR